MFSSRVLGAAKALGVQVQMSPQPAALADKLTADCRLVLVDLSLDGLDLPAVDRGGPRGSAGRRSVIAFGAHVDEAALADAAEAGCDLVLSRGQFQQAVCRAAESVAASRVVECAHAARRAWRASGWRAGRFEVRLAALRDRPRPSPSRPRRAAAAGRSRRRRRRSTCSGTRRPRRGSGRRPGR